MPGEVRTVGQARGWLSRMGSQSLGLPHPTWGVEGSSAASQRLTLDPRLLTKLPCELGAPVFAAARRMPVLSWGRPSARGGFRAHLSWPDGVVLGSGLWSDGVGGVWAHLWQPDGVCRCWAKLHTPQEPDACPSEACHVILIGPGFIWVHTAGVQPRSPVRMQRTQTPSICLATAPCHLSYPALPCAGVHRTRGLSALSCCFTL